MGLLVGSIDRNSYECYLGCSKGKLVLAFIQPPEERREALSKAASCFLSVANAFATPHIQATVLHCTHQ
jgi:hypothetical protein